MEGKVFINKAFCKAIDDYVDSKSHKESVKYNSFLVVIVRMLVLIYDELDILNPYTYCDSESLYKNMEKYGYSHSDLMFFLNLFEIYENDPSEDKFLSIQKMVIDMFMKKRDTMTVSDEVCSNFKNLLFSPESLNSYQVSYNFLMTNNPWNVIKYFDEKMKIKKEIKNKEEKKVLNISAYELLKYSLDDIDNMDAKELDEVNKKVYNYFDINENAINRNYLVDKAIYDLEHPKPSFSTGNGFVDVVFYLSIVATIGLVIIILLTIVL